MAMLRVGDRTVIELAKAIDLTDNAVPQRSDPMPGRVFAAVSREFEVANGTGDLDRG